MDEVEGELSRLQDMEALVVGLKGALRSIVRYYTKHPEASASWARDLAQGALDRFELGIAGGWRDEVARQASMEGIPCR